MTLNQLLEQRLPLTDRDHRSFGERFAELLVKHTDSSTTQHCSGRRLVAACTFQTLTHQTLVPAQLAVMTAHQLKPTQGSMQTLQRVTGVEDLERILKRVAPPPIDRRIDLDVSPREHQQRRLELVNCGVQHAMDIQHRQSSKIQDALRHLREAFVQMVGEVDRPDRKDRIAGQPHQQHPFLLWCHVSCHEAFGTLTSAAAKGA